MFKWRGDNSENTVTTFWNLLLRTHWINFKPTCHKTSLGKSDSLQVKTFNSPKRDNDCFLLLLYSTLWYNYSSVQMCLLIGNVSQLSDVAHGPLVFITVYTYVRRDEHFRMSSVGGLYSPYNPYSHNLDTFILFMSSCKTWNHHGYLHCQVFVSNNILKSCFQIKFVWIKGNYMFIDLFE